jgi:hypothetical protein
MRGLRRAGARCSAPFPAGITRRRLARLNAFAPVWRFAHAAPLTRDGAAFCADRYRLQVCFAVAVFSGLNRTRWTQIIWNDVSSFVNGAFAAARQTALCGWLAAFCRRYFPQHCIGTAPAQNFASSRASPFFTPLLARAPLA